MASTSSNKFPVKLHNILQEAEKTPYLAEIVSWSPDGKSFKVHHKDEFSRVILPATFGTNVYKSFQRNLHFWGYQNIRKGPSKGLCSHPHFIRDRPELLSKMRRVRAPSRSNEQDGGSHEDIQQSGDSPQMDKDGVPAFARASIDHRRVISPSMTSTPPPHLTNAMADHLNMSVPPLNATHNAASFLGGNASNPAALLLFLQQQQQHQYQKNEAETQQQQQQALAESLLVRHLLAQQEQQQQQKLIQELLAASIGQGQQPSTHPSQFDQNALTRAIVNQLLQQPTSQSNGINLLSSLLR